MSNQVRELEKRIEALEQEVQLLNVQIKHTLLEIQEHLLNRTYPALQSNDMALIETTELPAQTADPAASQKKPSPHSHVSRIRFDEAGHLAEVEAPAVIPERLPQPPTPQKDESLLNLEDWMLKKVQQVGASRTRRLIAIYAQNGQLSASSARALEQLLKVYDEPPSSRPEKPGSRSSALEIPPLPESIRHAVEYDEAPATKPARSKSASSTARTQTPEPRPARRSERPQSQAVRSIPASAPDKDAKLDHEPNMVLRLIAGVQSAGIGITRRKSHG